MKNIKVLTAAFTLLAKSLNSWDDLFASCDEKVCCSLNPNMIFKSADGASVGAPVVMPGWADVPFTGRKVELSVSLLNISC